LTFYDDGIALDAVLERAGEEKGPLMIVLHGFTSSKDKPHTLLACEAMREAGFSTLRVDLYGHGRSGGEFRKHTLYKWISNVMTVIREVRKFDFVTEIWLSGHSQGGLVAALVAAMEPEYVKGLVLRAPAFMIPRCAREGNMLGVRFDRVPDESEIFKGLTLDGEYIRVARTIHPEEAVDGFAGPVLILHGDQDDVVPLADSKAAAERYRRGELMVLQGESHHFDHCQAEMLRVIRDWLQRPEIRA